MKVSKFRDDEGAREIQKAADAMKDVLENIRITKLAEGWYELVGKVSENMAGLHIRVAYSFEDSSAGRFVDAGKLDAEGHFHSESRLPEYYSMDLAVTAARKLASIIGSSGESVDLKKSKPRAVRSSWK